MAEVTWWPRPPSISLGIRCITILAWSKVAWRVGCFWEFAQWRYRCGSIFAQRLIPLSIISVAFALRTACRYIGIRRLQQAPLTYVRTLLIVSTATWTGSGWADVWTTVCGGWLLCWAATASCVSLRISRMFSHPLSSSPGSPVPDGMSHRFTTVCAWMTRSQCSTRRMLRPVVYGRWMKAYLLAIADCLPQINELCGQASE